MVTQAKAQNACKRLAAGQGGPLDVYNLLLWLRDKTGGRAAVRDAGDFVAHAAKRDKGETWQYAESVFSLLNFRTMQVRQIAGDSAGIISKEDIERAVRGGQHSLNEADIKAQLGVSRSKATKVVERALGKITGMQANTFQVTAPLSSDEAAAVQCFSGLLKSAYRFDGTTFLQDIAELCAARHLLAEIRPETFVNEAKNPIFVTLLSVMHGAVIKVRDCRRASVNLAIAEGGQIEANLAMLIQPDPLVLVAFPVARADLDASDTCSPKLANELLSQGGQLPVDICVDLNSEGRLCLANEV